MMQRAVKGFTERNLRIGTLEISPPLLLAPMAENTSWPMRLLCRRFGAALAFTEMVTTHPFAVPTRQTLRILERGKGDEPLGVQVCGNEPDLLARCAANAVEMGFDLIDFNLGCPVRRMVGRDYGGGLMRRPRRVAEALSALVRHSAVPVTVKIRKGFDENSVNAVEIARIAEDCGAAGITVHGRTVRQKYAGRADWDIIGEVKAAVGIPVVGNGDVRDGPSAEAMLEHTGCDGVMVGRAALGRPWVFRDILLYFETGAVPERPDWEEIKKVVAEHARMLVEYVGDGKAALLMRRYLVQYCKGMPYSSRFRERCQQLLSVADLEEFMDGFPYDYIAPCTTAARGDSERTC
ncbi:MAG: tRNA dihydrouridine synthase DusB [Planctomycetota bacterium]|nr:MAG: tRNA dihydrouridine synthase DusB [Planctomycetota bacterium]